MSLNITVDESAFRAAPAGADDESGAGLDCDWACDVEEAWAEPVDLLRDMGLLLGGGIGDVDHREA